MANRREFIQACVAASALPSAAVLSAETTFARTTAPTFFRTIFDERFPQSIAFGAEAGRLGEVTRSISGDITQLWYNDIDAQWRRKPLAIAGLTTFGPLFCLERWGWDAGLRVVFRAEHRAAQGRIQHSVSGPKEILDEAQTRLSGPDWPVQMARLAVACNKDICPISEASLTGHMGVMSTADDEALISWVIAPITRT